VSAEPFENQRRRSPAPQDTRSERRYNRSGGAPRRASKRQCIMAFGCQHGQSDSGVRDV